MPNVNLLLHGHCTTLQDKCLETNWIGCAINYCYNLKNHIKSPINIINYYLKTLNVMFQMSMHKNYAFVKYAFFIRLAAEGWVWGHGNIDTNEMLEVCWNFSSLSKQKITHHSLKQFSNIYTFLPTRFLNKQ